MLSDAEIDIFEQALIATVPIYCEETVSENIRRLCAQAKEANALREVADAAQRFYNAWGKGHAKMPLARALAEWRKSCPKN